jgi:hypothetical protein
MAAHSSRAEVAGTDPRWSLVERICASPHLQRSVKLRELLRYLCRRAWDEGAVEIREQEIGVAVFGRAPNYDSTQETIVRVQASQLRKRLESYFAADGREETQILEIGKGSYVPNLRHVGEAEQRAIAPTVPNSPAVPILAGLCVALAAACTWLVFRTGPAPSQAPRAGPTVQRFWSAFTRNGLDTYVVVADSAFAATQDAIGRRIGLDEYVRRSYLKEFDSPELPERFRTLLHYLAARRFTSLADVMMVRRLVQYRLLDGARSSVVFPRDHNSRAFYTANHILIGSETSTPWGALFADSMDFELTEMLGDGPVAVVNQRPAAGEPSRFENPARGPRGDQGFALIACLPNLGKTGHVLILAGSDMSGTEAAGNLMTTEAFLADVWRRLPPVRDGELPHFEVLLRTRTVEATSSGFEIVALHPH